MVTISHNIYKSAIPEYSGSYVKFDADLDDLIYSSLDKHHSMSFTALHKEIRSNKKICLDAFNSHLKKLRSNGLLDKQDTGQRGKKVDYYLTDQSKQLQRLGIFNSNFTNTSECRNPGKKEKRLNLYLLILFLAWRVYYPYKTEKEVIDFLSDAGLSMNDLVLRRRTEKKYLDGKNFLLTIWDAKSVSISKLEYLDTPDSEISYRCHLPGMSPSEVLPQVGRVFKHKDVKLREIEDAFDLAKREGLLKFIMRFREEPRYEIAEPAFEEFLFDCWELFRRILRRLEPEWRSIKSPNEIQKKWLELLKGRGQADKMRREYYEARRHLSKERLRFVKEEVMKEVEIRVTELSNCLDYIIDQHFDIIKKYEFLATKILQTVIFGQS